VSKQDAGSALRLPAGDWAEPDSPVSFPMGCICDLDVSGLETARLLRVHCTCAVGAWVSRKPTGGRALPMCWCGSRPDVVMPVEHRRQLELCPLVVGVEQSAPERGLARWTDLAYQMQRMVAFGAAAVGASGDPGWYVWCFGASAHVECARPPHLAEGGAYDVHRLGAIG